MTTSPDAGAIARLRAALRARLPLHPHWHALLRRAWSVRLAGLAALLSGAEVVCAVFADDPPLARGSFAALSGLLTVAAALARLVSQSNLTGDGR